jgi:GntR family negative regulator for fad regulon and positive regulator of fabA
MKWDPPQKPAELTETRLIRAILDGVFPINSFLPAERDLAEQLGTTRPTLREVLQRLSRDGWIEIHHGKPTRVRDFWREGNLSVLAAVAEHSDHLPDHFINNLLTIRQLMAPTYTRQAIENQPEIIVNLLEQAIGITDDPTTFTNTDWNLHHQLTILSGNPIFTLILNGFRDLYYVMGEFYFNIPDARSYSRDYYSKLLICAQNNQPNEAEIITCQVMEQSLEFWNKANQ